MARRAKDDDIFGILLAGGGFVNAPRGVERRRANEETGGVCFVGQDNGTRG